MFQLKFAFKAIGILLLACPIFAQETSTRTYTRADFVNVTGGSLSDRLDRAFKQFKDARQGDSLWVAYHFPARADAATGPFSGTIYYDEGIRLVRRTDPANTAIFLLVEASGAQPVTRGVRLLDLSEPYVFENRPVYWLGDVSADESIAQLEAIMRGASTERGLGRSALRAIAAHESPRILPLLKEVALRETDADLRRTAIASLPRAGGVAGLDALDDLYRRAPDAAFRREVVRAYTTGGDRAQEKRVFERLGAIARSEEGPEVRVEAVRRLGSFRADGSTEQLISIYDGARTDEVKEEVIRQLSPGSNRRAADKLLAIAREETNPKLRQAAVRRLSQGRERALGVGWN